MYVCYLYSPKYVPVAPTQDPLNFSNTKLFTYPFNCSQQNLCWIHDNNNNNKDWKGLIHISSTLHLFFGLFKQLLYHDIYSMNAIRILNYITSQYFTNKNSWSGQNSIIYFLINSYCITPQLNSTIPVFYQLTYLLSPWSRVLLEKPTVCS
jgi:hypothetical protein